MRSGLMRYTIELTDQDTQLYGPTISTAEIKQMLVDLTWEFTEAQNAHQGSANPDTGEITNPET